MGPKERMCLESKIPKNRLYKNTKINLKYLKKTKNLGCKKTKRN